MKTRQFSIVLMAVASFVIVAAQPASGIVVAYEDFEDDTPTPSISPGLTGPPTNINKPGRWIPNQFIVPDPWFDELDTDPDTNWQLQVTENLGPDEGFFDNRHTTCPLYEYCSGRMDDCSTAGLTEPGPCDNDHFARDGFLQFTDSEGNPRPAVPGDKLTARFEFTSYDGMPVFALTNDLQKMVDDTANTDLHPPLTKWTVGFGQTFNPLDEGLEAWQSGTDQHPNVVSLLVFVEGYNGRQFDVWVPQDETDLSKHNFVFELEPDFKLRDFNRTVIDDPGYQTFTFEYTVGNSTYDFMSIDLNEGAGPEEVRLDSIGTTDEGPGSCAGPAESSGECVDHPAWSPGGLVPIGQPRLLDPAKNPDGPNQIEGIIFSDTGGIRGQTQYFIDDICIVINGSLAECDGPPPTLLGDSNNDNQVTGADLIAVQQNFGTVDKNNPTDGLLVGDANDDGQVTGADLITVQQNFGNVLAAPVPEPAMLVLMSLGSLGFLRRSMARPQYGR